jgi:hypothetical protein
MGMQEGSDTGTGGASLPHRQEPLQIPEGSIPGLKKNLAQLHTLFVLTNLILAARMLRMAEKA